MTWWQRYEPTRPIPVKGGIKARSQRGDIGKSWWAQRWIEALQRIMDPGRLGRGRSYARRGQVIEIHVGDGEVTARVQGSRRTPYKVSIKVKPLRDADWEQVLDVLADQAIFTAQLLAGDMPTDIEEAFAAADTSLFPTSSRELITNCSCPDWANPCKHIAAVYFLLGEAFDNDPFMLFRLRGRTQEQVLAELRARRAIVEEEEAGSDSDFGLRIPDFGLDSASPIPEDPDAFWHLSQPLDDFQIQPRAPQVSLSLLQRLGNPPFAPTNLRNALGPAYHTVSRRAEALALGKEGESAIINNAPRPD